MNKTLTKVALCYRAVCLDINREEINNNSEVTVPVMAFVARLKENGFCVSEELLHALNAVSADTLAEITECINDVMGVDLNWAPLVKGWSMPTGESCADHLQTWIANIFGGVEAGFKGTTLQCGHFIPDGTFPLERYNGCPFCGTPFHTADFVYKGQGSKLKELRLFTDSDMRKVFDSLLSSATPLDATQKDSLEHLLKHHMLGPLDRGADAAKGMKQKLKLKYDRKACLRVALWMNSLPMTAKQAAENMNPKRGMWVRMIRALRMGEYSRRKGMEHLAEILDVFYKQDYSTWQGRVDKACSENDAATTLSLLKERPGFFARSLFATMLRFGSNKVLAAFDEIADKLPARLLLSLGNAAEIYFDPNAVRVARPITGVTHRIKANKLLALYDEDSLKTMVSDVNVIYRDSMERRFAAQKTDAKSIFIDPMLYNIPISVGDRATTIQDASCALMGTRFPVEGDSVRLFLQWGRGLHAQYLDMDLSCRIAYPNNKTVECAYFNLDCVGAKHSGDIRSIPEMVGTAEYIELSLPEIEAAGAKYVTFTCNAYSCGSLSPNLVVGWMDSAFPMKISEATGVAYDPSCVQHMVRISEGNLSKGLVFGVLDVAKREIIWLEMPFTSQTVHGADSKSIEALLGKLESKLSIGELLDMKVMAQKLSVAESAEEADEVYTYEWAFNPAEVTKLLYL